MQMPSDASSYLQRIGDWQRGERIPSAVAAAAVGDEIVFSGGVGAADASEPKPIDGDLQYRIGSITKTFTAALVVSLAREGVLALDDRVGEHIGGTQMDRVTLLQLLSHSSGLQREPLTPMWQTFVGPEEAELAASLLGSELVDEPGRRWHYSNLGYAVLGQIVLQATGETCESLTKKRFLDPLGLARTSWQSEEPAAVGYRVDPYQDLLHPEPDMQQNAAGMGGQMWSTTTDLLEWAQALMGRRPEVLSAEVVDAMHTVRIMTDTEQWQRGWGLGLILDRRLGRIWAGHTGAVPGFAAALITDRTTGVAVCVLANTMGAQGLDQITFDLAEAVLSDLPAPSTPEPWTPGEPCPDHLADVLGSWWFEGGEVAFSWRGRKLRADFKGGSGGSSTLEPEADDRFRSIAGREQGEVLVIHRDEDGAASWLEWATYPYSRQPR